MSLYQMILSSSFFVQLVLMLLLGASVLSWAIALKKWRQLKEIKLANQVFMDIYYNNKKLNDIMAEAKKIEIYGHAHLFRRGYEEFIRLNEHTQKNPTALKEYFADFGMSAIHRSLHSGINEINELLEKKQSTLASIGNICPFLGLFGTVWGIISAFMGISEGGTTLDSIAPGIGEALVATALGLFAAIPAVIFYNYFNNENSKLNLKMESFCQDFLNMLERLVSTLK